MSSCTIRGLGGAGSIRGLAGSGGDGGYGGVFGFGGSGGSGGDGGDPGGVGSKGTPGRAGTNGLAGTSGGLRFFGSGGSGGGIYNAGVLSATACTIANGNAISGGGIYNAGGTLSITACTVSGNSGGGVYGGGTLRNTIVALNLSGASRLDVTGLFSSGGYNLIGVTNGSSGFSGGSHDIVGSLASPRNPLLGPLQDNGGPTFTMALLPGSPAIDKGDGGGMTTDQRGELRPNDNPAVPNASGGDGTDIGAYETGPDLNLVVSVAGSGSVSKSPDQSGYWYLSMVSLIPTPSTGWHFSGWSGDASGSQNPLPVRMTNNQSITANFVQAFTLALATNGSGAVARIPDQAFYVSNFVVNVTATPAPGWGFGGWSGDASTTSNPLSVTMTNDKSITANFFQPSLTVSSTGGGNVIKNPDQFTYAYNSTVTLSAFPVLGYAFAGWSGNASGLSNPLNLVMTNNRVVTASFTSSIPDLIVDNTNATFTGSWTTTDGSGLGAGGKFGPDFAYAATVSSSSATATFRPNLPLTGNYDVYVWFPHLNSSFHGCSDAEYFVSASGFNETISVDQRQMSNAGQWELVESGRKFAQGTIGFVRLSNQSTDTGRNVVADAVRWAWSTNQVTQPYITGVTRGLTDATLTWRSRSNQVYRLQYKTNLNAATPWTDVTGHVTATNATSSKTDTTLGGATQRFYRVDVFQ